MKIASWACINKRHWPTFQYCILIALKSETNMEISDLDSFYKISQHASLRQKLWVILTNTKLAVVCLTNGNKFGGQVFNLRVFISLKHMRNISSTLQ